MKFCCDGFEHVYSNNKKGFFIEIEKVNDDLTFWLSFNSTNNPEILDGIKLPQKLILGSRVPITYCPWCGKKLKNKYKA